MLAPQHPEIPGLILFAPEVRVKNLWVVRLISLIKKYLAKGGDDDILPWKGYTVYPLKAAVELLELQKHTREIMNKIHQPLLLFPGEVAAPAMDVFYPSCGSWVDVIQLLSRFAEQSLYCL